MIGFRITHSGKVQITDNGHTLYSTCALGRIIALFCHRLLHLAQVNHTHRRGWFYHKFV